MKAAIESELSLIVKSAFLTAQFQQIPAYKIKKQN